MTIYTASQPYSCKCATHSTLIHGTLLNSRGIETCCEKKHHCRSSHCMSTNAADSIQAARHENQESYETREEIIRLRTQNLSPHPIYNPPTGEGKIGTTWRSGWINNTYDPSYTITDPPLCHTGDILSIWTFFT